MGGEGEFCKHCVAVGLTWLEAGKPKFTAKGKAPKAVTMDDVRAHLLGQDKSALVNMLVEHAMEDDRLRQRLLMKAAKKAPRGSILLPFGARLMKPWKWTDSSTTEAHTNIPEASKK